MSDPCKVLVLDDPVDGFDLWQQALSKHGEAAYDVSYAKGGNDGIDAIERNRPDCVILGYSPPGTDCVDVLKQVRETHPFLPVVVVAGQAEEAVAVELLEAGAQDYISEAGIAGDLLHPIIHGAIETCRSLEQADEKLEKPLRILIIDDNQDDRELCIRTLKQIDKKRFLCLEAGSGARGLEMLKQSEPDCVLLDYSLPGQTGIEILSCIRREHPYAPVIMMTGQGNEEVAVEAMKSGAQNYLVKGGITRGTLHNAVHGAIEHCALERKLAEKDRALEQMTERLSLILENAGEGIYVLDAKGRTTFANRAALEMLGYSLDEMMSVCQHDLIHHYYPDGSEYPREDCEVYAAFRDGKTHREDGEVFWHKDGRAIPVEYTSKPIRDGRGEITGAVVVFRDITERKKLLDILTESNAELERFAYVASHDLQEPLRTVMSFTELLERRYRDQLDDRAKEYIDFAVNGARRMQELIRDLLDYARIGEKAERYEYTDVNAILSIIEENLKDTIQSSNAAITYANLPSLYVNPVRLMRVLQNVIGNGLKYQEEGRTPAIHVSAERRGGEYLFTVKDNGIGMKPEYCQKIFEPFRRLHRHEEYSGTGMGLSICRKLVEGMGGAIWAESEPGQGSTFRFTVPARSRTRDPKGNEQAA